MKPGELVLRDVHLPPVPGVWPWAPGWWWLAGAVLLLIVLCGLYVGYRRRRRQRWAAWFDQACEQASPAAQVAAMSELLRRAARRVDAGADRLRDQAWLEFLDGGIAGAFSQGEGRLLLEGGYRRQVDAEAVLRLRPLARSRFLQLMAGRR